MARLVARFGITRYEADEYYRIALDSFQKKNLEEAVLNINYAIEMYPRRAEYYAARGYFRLQDGLPDEATADFEHALTINPYEVLANFGKGVIAYNRKDIAQSQEYLLKAWAADTERAETLYYLALTYHRQRDNLTARQYMGQAADRFQKLAETDRDARKHLRNAEKWIHEFDRLIEEQQRREERVSPRQEPS